jgi:hypothetical protein
LIDGSASSSAICLFLHLQPQLYKPADGFGAGVPIVS